MPTDIDGLPTNRAKIMVVDDDPDLRQALSLRLRANNFERCCQILRSKKAVFQLLQRLKREYSRLLASSGLIFV